MQWSRFDEFSRFEMDFEKVMGRETQSSWCLGVHP